MACLFVFSSHFGNTYIHTHIHTLTDYCSRWNKNFIFIDSPKIWWMRFLYIDYKTSFYYYEVIILFRKVNFILLLLLILTLKVILAFSVILRADIAFYIQVSTLAVSLIADAIIRPFLELKSMLLHLVVYVTLVALLISQYFQFLEPSLEANQMRANQTDINGADILEYSLVATPFAFLLLLSVPDFVRDMFRNCFIVKKDEDSVQPGKQLLRDTVAVIESWNELERYGNH